MKKIKLCIFLLLSTFSFAQVGINTTAPTNDLDVNGGVRVRELQEGTVQSDNLGNLNYSPYKVYAFVVIDKQGTILKQFGITSVDKLSNTKYRIYFTTSMIDNDYIILAMGKNRNISYDSVTTNYVEVIVDNAGGNFDFNVMIVDLL